MKKTLIAIFSIVALPLGLVVGVSATDPSDNHTVSYTVLPLRAISVEQRTGGGSPNIDFSTVPKTTSVPLENNALRLNFTAQDADSESAVKITAALGTGQTLGTGVTLTVTPATVSDSVTTGTLAASNSLSTTPANVITGAYKSGGITNATSDLTYKLSTSDATSGPKTVTVTYTLSNN